jgi:hypothetical protein
METLSPTRFYVYRYNRVDGTPYYVGKGTRSRAYSQHNHMVKLPPRERIQVIEKGLTADQADQQEIALIKKYGRKDLGTGCLCNLTDGGNGIQGHSPITRKKMSDARSNVARPHEVMAKTQEAKLRQGAEKYDVAFEVWSSWDAAQRRNYARRYKRAQNAKPVNYKARGTNISEGRLAAAAARNGVDLETWRNMSKPQRDAHRRAMK